MSRAVAMNKRPRLHSDPSIDSSLALLVRSMRTALGPADDEPLHEDPPLVQPPEAPLEQVVPSAGIMRVPTQLRTSRSTSEATPVETPAVSQRSIRLDSSGFDNDGVSGDSDNPMLSGVFRKTRNRTLESARSHTRRNDTPILSILPPGDALKWDEFNEPVADAEIDDFLSASGADLARPSAGATTEAPTPFAPDTYSDWSEKNSRGES
jgi:hypothetical protein